MARLMSRRPTGTSSAAASLSSVANRGLDCPSSREMMVARRRPAKLASLRCVRPFFFRSSLSRKRNGVIAARRYCRLGDCALGTPHRTFSEYGKPDTTRRDCTL